MLTILVFLGLYHQKMQAQETNVLHFNFYSEDISLVFDPQMLNIRLEQNSDLAVNYSNYFDNLYEKTAYYYIIGSLREIRTKLKLSNWFYYLLIQQTVDNLLSDHNLPPVYNELLTWFLLTKAGFYTSLNFDNSVVSVSVFTSNTVFDTLLEPFSINTKTGWMVNLSASNALRKGDKALYQKIQKQTNFEPIYKQKIILPFAFFIDSLPKLIQPKVDKKYVHFLHDNKEEEISYLNDINYIELLYYHPSLSLEKSSHIPLPEITKTSLFDELKSRMANMNDTEAVRYLMSFTRQAFVYASDDSLYKDTYDLINVTFSPTETLYYESSDCEDRAVLFAYLVRELVKLDVIIIEYDTHANTAVLFDPPIGNDHIFYEGKTYSICDPTGPSNDMGIGQTPPKYRNAKYTVVKN